MDGIQLQMRKFILFSSCNQAVNSNDCSCATFKCLEQNSAHFIEGLGVHQLFLVREVENHHQRHLLFNFSVALPSNAEQLLCREEQHNCLPGTDRCLKQFHARVKIMPELQISKPPSLYYILQSQCSKSSTGKSFSEALFLASTNPQYDKRLFIELKVQYMKIASSEHAQNMLCT